MVNHPAIKGAGSEGSRLAGFPIFPIEAPLPVDLRNGQGLNTQECAVYERRTLPLTSFFSCCCTYRSMLTSTVLPQSQRQFQKAQCDVVDRRLNWSTVSRKYFWPGWILNSPRFICTPWRTGLSFVSAIQKISLRESEDSSHCSKTSRMKFSRPCRRIARDNTWLRFRLRGAL